MTAHPSTPQSPIRRFAPVALTVAATIGITIAMTILSATTGGFGSDAAMRSDARGWSWPIVIHLATVVPALFLGPFILLRRKGDRLHRILGRVVMALLMVTAIASAFIRTPGAGIAGTGFSFIHVFTVWTLVNVPLGIWLARSGNIAGHRRAMKGLYLGLVIAGAFTFLPGRLLGNLVFG